MTSSSAPSVPRWLRFAMVEALALFVLLSGLWVPYHRHGWPFSFRLSATVAHQHHHAPASGHSGHVNTVPSPDDRSGHAVAGRTTVSLHPARQELIGVRFARVERTVLTESLRAVAIVVPDESRVSHVHTRVSGWIERLYVNTTGQRVRAGQPLAEIFSRELLSAQNEYLAIRQFAQDTDTIRGSQTSLLEASRNRLRVLGMTDDEIALLDRTGTVRRTSTVVAQRSGVILHRGIAVGTAVDPSTELMTVVDLSRVWVFAEIPESFVPLVRVGTSVQLTFPAASRVFASTLSFLYPTLSEQTRTLRVRMEVLNPEGTLRPGMYGTAEIQLTPRESLAIPRDALVDTGAEQHVFVRTAPDTLTPRRVVPGLRVGNRVEIREGLREGETIVASGVFLIDSESRLRASIPEGGGHAGHGP